MINNAGFGLFGEFVTADLDEELRTSTPTCVPYTFSPSWLCGDFAARTRLHSQRIVLGGILPTADGDHACRQERQKLFFMSQSENVCEE